MRIIFLLMFMGLHASDVSLSLDDEHLSSSRQEAAEIIFSSFFQKNGNAIKDKLTPRLVERLEHEQPEFCIMVSDQFGNKVSERSTDVSERVLEVFTATVELVIEEHIEERDNWRKEADSRCKKTTVMLISGLLSLASAATAAAISAAITSAID